MLRPTIRMCAFFPSPHSKRDLFVVAVIVEDMHVVFAFERDIIHGIINSFAC